MSSDPQLGFNIEELILDHSIDCIIFSDAQGRIRRLNKSALNLFGYEEPELLGRGFELLYADAQQSTIVRNALQEKGSFSGEVINRDKSGRLFFSYLSANRCFNQSGDFIGTMGISREISEQKKLLKDYDSILNNILDIVYTANTSGYFTFFNNAVYRILGYKPEELVGKHFSMLIHPETLADTIERFTQFVNQKRAESDFEFRLLKKNGEEIWIQQRVQAVYNPLAPDQITGYHAVVRDITDKKTAQLRLQQSEKQLQQLFDNSSDLIQSVSLDGRFLYTNKTWQEKIGYTGSEISRINLFDVIHPSSHDDCRSVLNQIVQGVYDYSSRHRYKALTRDGQILVLEGAVTIQKEGEQVASIQSFLRDITLQSEYEQLLKKSESNFRQITETLNDVFYLYNIDEKKYEYISPNCAELLGADEGFFYQGKSYNSLFVHPDDVGRMREANRLVDSGIPYDIEYRIIIRDEVRWINEKSFPIKDEKGVTRRNSGICRDITASKEALDLIYRQNMEIGDSVLYAKNLQDSSIPTEAEVQQVFPDSFVFFRPKGILSGDFYMADEIITNDQLRLRGLVVADCTGHGIPGGILSLMCSSLLRESFTNQDVNSPSDSLEFVRRRLIRFFRSDSSNKIHDGMDIGFCVVNDQAGQMYFAGANNSCIVIRNGELTEYKGDRQHVGYSAVLHPFTSQTIQVSKGDMVYLFSDGFIDQFGGPEDRRFMKKSLKELLLSIHQDSADDQYDALRFAFTEWKGENDQTDDVTVAGFRI